MTTWDEILSREDIIGKDLETIEGGRTYRGPISQLFREGDNIVFLTSWTALKEIEQWTDWPINRLSVNVDYAQPVIKADGSIVIEILLLGTATVYPHSNLDRSVVKGLQLT